MARKIYSFLIALLAVFVAYGANSPLPAVAETTHFPIPRIVHGDRTLTLTWPGLTAGTRYRIQYGRDRQLRHAQVTPATPNTTVTLPRLVNNQKYYLRLITDAGNLQQVSPIYTAVPRAGYPCVLPKVNVQAGELPDQIRVSWGNLQCATRVIVLAGGDNQQHIASFNSGWLPATTTAVTLTVPVAYRCLLGTGTGNPIYVKLGQYNNATATTILTKRSDALAYRLSLANSYGYATPQPITGTTAVNVATYNIQSVSASPVDHPWSLRMPRVINNILAAAPDLIGLQEDDAAQSMNYQHRQVATALAPHGYAMAGDLPAGYRYNFDVTDAWVYYKTAVFTRLDGGIISPRDDLGLVWPAGLKDTRGTWNKFELNTTGEIFYVLNIHLPATGSAGIGANALIPLRLAEISALSTYMRLRAGDDPIILLGDLNSAVFRDGYSAPAKLHDLGWYDTASATRRVNADLLTANSPVGYPTGKPHRANNVSTGRIDYIFTSGLGGAKTYTNQSVLNPDGTINLAYQGSDHNLQRATLMF